MNLTRIAKSLTFLIVALVVLNLVATNRLVGQGQTINDLTQEIHKVEHENRKLQLKIAKSGSLLDAQEIAQEVGFDEPTNIATLKAPSQVALNE